MSDNRNFRLLYQARYEVCAKESFGIADVWPLIVGKYYDWVLKKKDVGLHATLSKDIIDLYENDSTIHLRRPISKAFAHGSLSYSSQHADAYELRTAASFDPGNENRPRYWAMETTQPDKKHSAFRWVTRVGITSLVKHDATTQSGTYVVNLSVHANITSSSLGWSPQGITERPQQVASMLFDLECLEVRSGSATLTGTPQEMLPEDVSMLANVIEDSERDFPVVVMASQPYTCVYPVTPSDLARELRESAVVYLLCEQDQELLRTYSHYFPWEGGFACPNGCARIYLPHADLSKRSDARRHLVFGERELQGEGMWQFIARTRRFASISCRRRTGEVASPDDIIEMQRAKRAAERLSYLHEIREIHAINEKEAMGRANDPLVASLAEEALRWDELVSDIEAEGVAAFNTIEFTKQLERIEALEAEVAEYVDLADALENEADKLRKQLDRTKADLAYQRYRASELERSNATDTGEATERFFTAMLDITRFPRTLADVVELASRAFEGRLVFLPEAHSSATNGDKDGASAFVDELWGILVAMATQLWPLYFEETGIDVRALFENYTGWALALNEGSSTQASREMMMLRRRIYKGAEIVVSAHVKGKQRIGEKTLRVHYAADNDDRVLVIGHCGWHLDSMSSNYL